MKQAGRFGSMAGLALSSLLGCGGVSENVPAAAPPSAAGAGPREPAFDRAAAERDVTRELDDLHDAAAHADEPRYLAHFAHDAVFLGTDAKERWDLPAFTAFLHPHFAQGKGWTYHVERRAVSFDADGGTAWFDEDLRGERLGPARGSGVLVREGGRWRVAQYNLALTIPNERFDELHAMLESPPRAELHARHDRAYREATEAVAHGDTARAAELLARVVDEAKTRPGDDLEFWIDNELTWIRWIAGDPAGARAEVDHARTALDHSTLPADKVLRLRLHELWDRAYLALDEARHEKGAARARWMAEADRDRAAYDAAAKPAGDHDGMAVLAAFFAWAHGDGRAAGVEAKKVDMAHDDDLQDIYVLGLALESAGDNQAAESARTLVCKGHDYLMKPIVVRAMAADGHPCPP